jgi:hypothetical protein
MEAAFNLSEKKIKVFGGFFSLILTFLTQKREKSVSKHALSSVAPHAA